VVRILLVEDDASAVETVREILSELPGHHLPVVATNRDEAIGLLTREFFDLMILDLRIPAENGSPSALPEHGLAVFGRAKDAAPGMPIFLFTGSSVEDFVPSLLAGQQQVDIWGSEKLGTVQVVKKIDLDKLGHLLSPYIIGCRSLADVELEREGDLLLSTEDERLIRIFARRFEGSRCVVTALSGGLSSSRVLKVKVLSPYGTMRVNAVAKLGTIEAIQDESRRYQQYVVQLTPGATPRLLLSLEFGAKAMAGVFYGLAAGHDESFFRVVGGGSKDVIRVAVRGTEAGLSGWYEGAAEGQHRVRDIRRGTLSDAEAARILATFNLPWVAEFEDRVLQARWGCVHGDLHGGNVLLTAAGQPQIIDYGDIDQGASSFDAVALELSVLFHPDGPLRAGGWPSAEQARLWGNLDEYLTGCPCADFVRECRAWARRVAAGNREVAASAYAYLLRQLKYSDTNKQRSLDLLQGARQLLEST
jgi:CheY-like chemotaxis protein